MLLTIVHIPSSILRQTTKELTKQELASKELQKLIDNMCETMPAVFGIGLAAPQVNKNCRLTVIATDKKPLVVVNAKILKKSEHMIEDEEGCLSIPGVFGIVPRHTRIRVAFLDRKGKKIIMHAQGLLARVFQHEIDHLNGILFVDRTVQFTTPLTEEQRKAFEVYKVR